MDVPGLDQNYTYRDISATHTYTYGSTTLDFYYDQAGRPYALKHNGTVYYYILNLQGDVMDLVDSSGTQVAAYTYDPWGKVLTATGSLAAINPLRYRGYYQDSETGFYYLQSRYYDPQIGRFLNADSYASTGQGVLGHNMFAYCRNNYVCRVDIYGGLDEDCLDGNPMPDAEEELRKGATGGGGGSSTVGSGGGSSGTSNSGQADTVSQTANGVPAGTGSQSATSGTSGSASIAVNTQSTSQAPHRAPPGSTHTQLTSDGSQSVKSLTFYNSYGMPGIRIDYLGRSHGGIETPHIHFFSYICFGENVYRNGEMVFPAGR